MGRVSVPPAPPARAFRFLVTACAAVVLLAAGGPGCASGRRVTIAAVPPDAQVAIDGRIRGRGPVTEQLDFGGGQTHTVVVSRTGYNDRRRVLDGSEEQDRLVIELRPRTKRVRFVVGPLPGLVKVDGRPISDGAASQASTELPFAVDAADNWVPRVATAERPGFRPAEAVVRFTDSDSVYVLTMRPEQKDVTVATEPPGAEVFVEDASYGPSPARVPDLVIPTDPQTHAWLGRRVRAVKPGYEPAERVISWDGGQARYTLTLTPLADPPAVAAATAPAPDPDPVPAPPVTPSPATPTPTASVAATTLPVAPPATAPAASVGVATVPPPPPRPAVDPPFVMPQAPPRLEMLWLRFRQSRDGWATSTARSSVPTVKETAEPDGRKPTSVAAGAEGQTVDGPVTSADGMAVAWALLSEQDGRLRSQLFVRPTGGTDAGTALTDGTALDLMPAFAPTGRRLLFASDRAGAGRLGVFEVTTDPPRRVVSAAPGETGGSELWPTLDTSPAPRLYVESRPADGKAPRLVAVDVATGARTDLGHFGTQPRVSPRADAVVFVRADPATGKRDLYLLRLGGPGGGGEPVNLTNTPEVDEFDPAWSKTGSRIAFTSDRATAAAGSPSGGRPRDANIWVLRAARPTELVQVTANAAWDDSPSWSGDDRAIYFRSTRGGEWGVWSIDLPLRAP